mmetsp:Transcript_97402/g.203310  ORF Transcript_97402/g.203310 Transcript_97402/m.203310 type:complete len:200 (-) Transcript_97402:1015-1614(-)
MSDARWRGGGSGRRKHPPRSSSEINAILGHLQVQVHVLGSEEQSGIPTCQLLHVGLGGFQLFVLNEEVVSVLQTVKGCIETVEVSHHHLRLSASLNSALCLGHDEVVSSLLCVKLVHARLQRYIRLEGSCGDIIVRFLNLQVVDALDVLPDHALKRGCCLLIDGGVARNFNTLKLQASLRPEGSRLRGVESVLNDIVEG